MVTFPFGGSAIRKSDGTTVVSLAESCLDDLSFLNHATDRVSNPLPKRRATMAKVTSMSISTLPFYHKGQEAQTDYHLPRSPLCR